MPAAARVADMTTHPGALSGPGMPTVKIEGKPAIRVGDSHACSFPPPAGPHPPNAVVAGSGTVKIGGKFAARQGDPCACGATIAQGAITVNIGN